MTRQQTAFVNFAFTPGGVIASGTFSLSTSPNRSVDVKVFSPLFTKDFPKDTRGDYKFIYNDWALVGKTQLAEVYVDTTSSTLTLTFWYGDQVTAVCNGNYDPSVKPESTFARVAPCTFLVCSIC